MAYLPDTPKKDKKPRPEDPGVVRRRKPVPAMVPVPGEPDVPPNTYAQPSGSVRVAGHGEVLGEIARGALNTTVPGSWIRPGKASKPPPQSFYFNRAGEYEGPGRPPEDAPPPPPQSFYFNRAGEYEGPGRPPEDAPPPMAGGIPASRTFAASRGAPVDAPPPSDGPDLGALDEYRRDIIAREAEIRARMGQAYRSGDRVTRAQLKTQQAQMLEDLHRANQVRAGLMPQQSPEQVQAGRDSLQPQYKAGVKSEEGRLYGEQQSAFDQMLAAKRRAADLFLKPELSRPRNDAELLTDPGAQRERNLSLAGVEERDALARYQGASKNVYDYQPPAEIDFGPLPAPRAPVSEFDIQRVSEGVGAFGREREQKIAGQGRAAELAKVTDEAAIAKAKFEGAEADAKATVAGRITRGEDVGNIKGQIEKIESEKQLADAMSGATSEQISQSGDDAVVLLNQQGAFNKDELTPAISLVRGSVIEPLRERVRLDPVGVRREVARLKPRLELILTNLETGNVLPLWAAGIPGFGPLMAMAGRKLLEHERQPVVDAVRGLLGELESIVPPA